MRSLTPWAYAGRENYLIFVLKSSANTDADVLLWLVSEVENILDFRPEEVTKETINAITLSVKLQEQNETNWITAFTANHAILDENLYFVGNVNAGTISWDIIRTTQRESKSVEKVMKLVTSVLKPTLSERVSGTRETQYLLQEWNKLNLDVFLDHPQGNMTT